MLGVGPIDIDRLPETRARIDALIRRILAELPARRVILHGSFAKGGVHQLSDVDLIVVADFAERFFDRGERIRPLNLDSLPIEVLCYSPGEFDRMWAEGSAFIHHAVATGRTFGEPPPP